MIRPLTSWLLYRTVARRSGKLFRRTAWSLSAAVTLAELFGRHDAARRFFRTLVALWLVWALSALLLGL